MSATKRYNALDMTGNGIVEVLDPVAAQDAATKHYVDSHPGPTGPAGPTGPPGSTGATGAPGSVWYEGAGTPSSGTGINGDYYLNTTTGDVFQKVGGSWGTPIANIRGPAGPTGSTGPTGPSGPPSDGHVPTSSPTPVLVRGIGTIFASWPQIANADPVSYQVHISATAGFVPGPTTLYATVAGTTVTIKTDAAGNPLQYDTDPTGTATGVAYYVALIAQDADGVAPTASPDVGPINPAQVNGPDVAVDSITANQIAANTITGTELAETVITAGDIYIPSTSGRRVEIRGDGRGLRVIGLNPTDLSEVELIRAPTDGSGEPYLTGQLITDNLQVQHGMVVQGTDNRLDGGAVITLSERQQPPLTAPQVGDYYPGLDLTPYADATFQTGLHYDPAGGPGGATASWLTTETNYVAHTNTTTFWLSEFNASTGARIRRVKVTLSASQFGFIDLARIGTVIYVLVWHQNLSTGANSLDIIRFNQSDLSLIGTWSGLFGAGADWGGAMCVAPDGVHLDVITWSGTAHGTLRRWRYDLTGAITAGPTNLTGTQPTANINGGVTMPDQSYNIIDNGTGVVWHYSQALAFIASTDASLSNATGGIGYNGTRLVGVAGSGYHLVYYSSLTLAAPSTLWFGYTYLDASGHETDMSPIVKFSAVIGQWSTPYLTLAQPPGGITGFRVYALNQTAAPTQAQLLRQASTTYINTETFPGGGSVTVFMALYNAAGAAFVSGANPFPGATSQIKATAGSLTAPWQLQGDGRMVLPVRTAAQRLAGPAQGGVAYESDAEALTVYDGNGYQQIFPGVDAEDLYDALNALAGQSGLAAYPCAWSFDPESANGEFAPTGGDLRGCAFMMKRTVVSVGMGWNITLASVGSISNGEGRGYLFTINAAGNWTVVATTAALGATPNFNGLGKQTAAWRNSGDTATQTYQLVPGTVYCMAMVFPTFATSQPRLAASIPGGSGGQGQINLGVTPFRSGVVTNVTLRQTPGTVRTPGGATTPLLLFVF